MDIQKFKLTQQTQQPNHMKQPTLHKPMPSYEIVVHTNTDMSNTQGRDFEPTNEDTVEAADEQTEQMMNAMARKRILRSASNNKQHRDVMKANINHA